MAQAILLELPRRDPREALYDQLKTAPREHAEASGRIGRSTQLQAARAFAIDDPVIKSGKSPGSSRGNEYSAGRWKEVELV